MFGVGTLGQLGGIGGIPVFVPSMLFPSNIAIYDADFINEQYSGVTQPNDASNTDDGRFLRQQIITTQPNYLEQADGSLKTYTTTSAVRRTNKFGLIVEGDRNNSCLQNRSLNNAAFTLVGCTAAKDQIGRTGVANSASSVTLTATTATITQAIVDASSVARTTWVEAKQITGSGGVLTLSTDGGSTFPTVTSALISGAGALGYTKYRIPAQTLANPSVQIKITGAISDKWAIDFVESISGGDLDTGVEFAPVDTTTGVIRSWHDRPSAFTTAAVPSPPAVFLRDATAAFIYTEFWFRRDGALLASDSGWQVTVSAASGAGIGVLSPNNPTVTADYHNPIWNKLICWRSAAGAGVCLNGGTIATQAGANPANASTHNDLGTNGSGASRILGGQRRFVIGSNVAAAAAYAQALTT